MKVVLKVALSGTRNGVEWPARGSVVDLPDAEAVDMLNGGLAGPVLTDVLEVATAAPAVEKAARTRRVR